MPCANHAHGAIAQITAHLTLQGVVLGSGPQHGLLKFTNTTQKQHHGVFSNTFRGIGRGGNMHAQLLNQLNGQMVIANSSGKHVLHTIAMIGAHPLLPHLAGGTADAITALGQLQIMLIGIFSRPHKIDAILLTKFFRKSQFIKITQCIKSDFHSYYFLILV